MFMDSVIDTSVWVLAGYDLHTIVDNIDYPVLGECHSVLVRTIPIPTLLNSI
jgi:hypothetical protein